MPQEIIPILVGEDGVNDVCILRITIKKKRKKIKLWNTHPFADLNLNSPYLNFKNDGTAAVFTSQFIPSQNMSLIFPHCLDQAYT